MHSPAAVRDASVLDTSAPFRLVGLTALANDTGGSDTVPVALLDGPVDADHVALSGATLRPVGPPELHACADDGNVACRHGTFTAGILAAGRHTETPGICPDSPLLIRPIFTASAGVGASATSADVAAAIADTVDAGARVVNLSVELRCADSGDVARLSGALDYAARRGAIVVAAAGNRSAVTGSVLSQHPWVIPVAACDGRGAPLVDSNLGASIGRQGLLAPGERIRSLAPGQGTATLSGTSASAAIVSGAIALAWSLAPDVSAATVRWAIARAHQRRRSVVPPLLDGSALAAALTTTTGRARA